MNLLRKQELVQLRKQELVQVPKLGLHELTESLVGRNLFQLIGGGVS